MNRLFIFTFSIALKKRFEVVPEFSDNVFKEFVKFP